MCLVSLNAFTHLTDAWCLILYKWRQPKDEAAYSRSQNHQGHLMTKDPKMPSGWPNVLSTHSATQWGQGTQGQEGQQANEKGERSWNYGSQWVRSEQRDVCGRMPEGLSVLEKNPLYWGFLFSWPSCIGRKPGEMRFCHRREQKINNLYGALIPEELCPGFAGGFQDRHGEPLSSPPMIVIKAMVAACFC